MYYFIMRLSTSFLNSVWMVALEMNWDNSVIFEVAPKYYIQVFWIFAIRYVCIYIFCIFLMNWLLSNYEKFIFYPW